MDQIWLASPSAAMRLWPGRPKASWRLNPAALAWGRRIGLNESAWHAVAEELSAGHSGGTAGEGRLNVVDARWCSLPMSTGWLIWLAESASCEAACDGWLSVAEKLRWAQEIGRIGIFQRNLRTGAALWDAQMFSLLGFDPAAGAPTLAGALARIDPADIADFQTRYDKCLREPGRHTSRCRLRLPDGIRRDLQVLAETRYGDDGQPAMLIGSAADVTESVCRLQTQEAAGEHFAKAIRLARVGVWRVDLEQRGIELNDVGYDMMGLEPRAGGLPIDVVRACAHPDDVEALAAAAREAVERDSVVDLESRYLIPGSKEYRHVLTRRVVERDAHGRAIGLLGVTLEQTERMAERGRAQAVAQRVVRIADTAGVGVYSVDLQSGKVQWNRQMFLIHGLPEHGTAPGFDEFIAERVHPDDQANLDRRRLAFALAKGSFEGQVRIVRPDGSVHWVEYRSHRDRFGAGWKVFGIAIDVTERMVQRGVAETSLRDKEAAERVEAAKSELLARMSHELRTPLNAVLGFAQLIEQGGCGVPVEVQRERVGHIRQAGESLLALISDVLHRVEREGPSSTAADVLASTLEEPMLAPKPGGSDPKVAPHTVPQGSASVTVGSPAPLTVLYIEDNPVNVILVEQLVAMRPDTSLHCAADGLSGVAWAAEQQPDVVLVDMQLPDIDGFEVLRRLRSMSALDRSAIVALSANGISEDIALAREAGFDDYWTKPIDFRLFLSGLDKLAADR